LCVSLIRINLLLILLLASVKDVECFFGSLETAQSHSTKGRT
jgi:hypothetical protein